MNKRTVVCAMILLSGMANLHANWQDVFDAYKSVMKPEEYAFFSKIHDDFIAGKVPPIAAPEIKSIPIKENNKPVIDLRQKLVDRPLLNRIELLPDPSRPFEGPHFNSGLPSASKMRSALLKSLLFMISHLDDLAPAFGYEKEKITIKVFEALRDIKTQTMLFNDRVAELQKDNPDWSYETAEEEASKWISPVKNNVPAHSTGGAIDMGLWDAKNKKPVDMGILGTSWEHNPGPETFSENIPDDQKKNRLLLVLAAHRAGLANYPHEFWHYSVGDRYWAHTFKEPYAVFGAVAQ